MVVGGMKKIPTVLVRNPDDRAHVLPEIAPGCEWVLDGEGVPTRKYDGTCVMLDENGEWWARREVKKGKTPPARWISVDFDETTGKSVGWEPISQSPFAKFHAEAAEGENWGRGLTYELCGPKINGNPEGFDHHELIAHVDAQSTDVQPNSPDGLVDLVRAVGETGWEGIVWHHPDGRMAKLKVRDLIR